MNDYSRLDDAIVTTLRNAIADLRRQDDTLTLVACGMVEDLTGFFVAGAGAEWLTGLEGSDADKAESAWFPSEWPLAAQDDTDGAPGRVTSAIWELSGTQALIDGTGEELDDDAYDELRARYEERILEMIRLLQTEGTFVDARGNTVWVWLHSADASDEDLDNRTFSALQPGDSAGEFAERYSGGTSRLIARMTNRG